MQDFRPYRRTPPLKPYGTRPCRLTPPPPQHLVVEAVKAWSTSPRRACRGQIGPRIPHLPRLEPPCSSKRSPPRSSAAHQCPRRPPLAARCSADAALRGAHLRARPGAARGGTQALVAAARQIRATATTGQLPRPTPSRSAPALLLLYRDPSRRPPPPPRHLPGAAPDPLAWTRRSSPQAAEQPPTA